MFHNQGPGPPSDRPGRRASWAGTCQQFDLRLTDGTDPAANFQFK